MAVVLSAIVLNGVMHFRLTMQYLSFSFTALSIAAFSITTFSFLTAKAAIAAPWDSFDGTCTAKVEKTHDCLEELPAYSYHLALPSHYSQSMCLSLGNWEGENDIVVEWDGLQARHSIQGQSQQQQMLMPEQRSGLSSGIIIYSQHPILPDLIQGACKSNKGGATFAVTPSQWSSAEENNVAISRDAIPNDGPTSGSSPQISIINTP